MTEKSEFEHLDRNYSPKGKMFRFICDFPGITIYNRIREKSSTTAT